MCGRGRERVREGGCVCGSEGEGMRGKRMKKDKEGKWERRKEWKRGEG